MTPTTDTQVRDRLKAVREGLRDARSRRADAKKGRDEAKQAFADAKHDEDKKITDWPEFQAAEEAVRSLGTIDDEIADLQLAEQGILELLGEPSSNGNGNGNRSLEGQKLLGWDGRRLLASDTPYDLARGAGIFTSSAQFGTLQLGEIADRETAAAVLCGNLAPGRTMAELPAAPAGPVSSPALGTMILPDYRGLQAPILRPLRLLELFPTGTTDSNSLDYVQVTAIPSSAGVVAEGAVKPEQGITLVDAVAPVRTIAGWIKVNRQAMDDAAALSSLINLLLPYDVRRKIEFQILRGDGTGQNIKGILGTTGVGNPAAVAGDNKADAILRAMTTVILSDAEPNFAALHPLDWQDLLLMREDTAGAGSRTGMYLYGGPGQMAAATIWGLTITPSIALTYGQSLVGDSMGATVLFREGVNVKTSDSDQDDFVRNRVTVLAEARIAFPVWRPSHFAIADAT